MRIQVGKFTVQLLIVMTDTDCEQVQHIGEFLRKKGIRPEGPYVQRRNGKLNNAYCLAVSLEGGGLLALKRMLPFVDKKYGQVKASIDYLEDKITGDEFVRVLNEEVIRKKRRAPRRPFLARRKTLPHRRSEALRIRSIEAASMQKFKLQVRLGKDKIRQIKEEVVDQKIPMTEVAERYGISDQSVRRIVRGRR